MLTAPKLVGHQVPSSTTYSFTQIDKTKGNLNKTAYTQKERQKNNDLIAVFLPSDSQRWDSWRQERFSHCQHLKGTKKHI